MPVEVFIHKMTDHMESGRIVRWLAKEGERVERGQAIMEVETDKAVAELESPASGVLKGIRTGAQPGADVPVGETIAFIAEPDEQVPVLSRLTSPGAQTQSRVALPEASAQDQKVEQRVRASPAVRRVARELGVDLTSVTGTGPDGKITEADVRAFSSRGGSHYSRTAMNTMSLEPGEWAELNSVQRLTGERMLQSVQTAPQFALTVRANMTNALQIRESLKNDLTPERLSVTVMLVKIVATALKHQPRANASFDAGRVKLHRRVNVGIAIGTENGLIVPVIRDADQKELLEIATELHAFREKAREMRFSTEDLSGGTFTISNLGMYGIDHFNAIINPPQSAILAVGQVTKNPVALSDNTIAVRPLMNMTLTIDHRVMDGVLGAKFLAEIKERLENPDWIQSDGARQGNN
jgi:pyruvate dehydrogenase E2 component (dihydrolipoamide acetyltransferase)